MRVSGERELNGLREIGRIVRAALNEMQQHVRPGATTAELNDIGAAVLGDHSARSAPMLVYDFPAEICISLNDEIVHGIPSQRVIREGDLVKLDVTAEKGGFMADAAITVPVGAVADDVRRLVDCARQAFDAAMRVARAGRPINEIGRSVEAEARRAGFAVIRGLVGHGIGRTIHEEPIVPNFYEPRLRKPLEPGLVFTVEPMLAQGRGEIVQAKDGWTIRTVDGSLSSHYEQTIVVTDGEPLLVTG